MFFQEKVNNYRNVEPPFGFFFFKFSLITLTCTTYNPYITYNIFFHLFMSIWAELQCFDDLVTVNSSVQHERYPEQGKLEKWRRYNTIITSIRDKVETAK